MSATSTRTKVWSRYQKQAGLTLIELMVSLLIGLLLMGGALQVFFSSKGTYDAQQEAARLQENVRFANRFLTRDLRGVGFLGCGSNAEATSLLAASPAVEFGPDAMIRGWSWSMDGTGTLDLDSLSTVDPASAGGYSGPSDRPGGFQAREGSDMVQVWVAEGTARVDDGPAAASGVDEAVPIRDAQGLASAGALFITNCVDAYVTPYCDYSDGADQLAINESCGGTASTLGVLTYPADAIAMASHVFYIGENTIGRPALYRRTLDLDDGTWGDPLELVEGVEAMRIEYGVAGGTSGRVNSYESADEVDNWQQVVSVRFALLLVGEGRYPGADDTAEEYELFDGQTFRASADDERLGRVTRTTVTLRNRAN